MFLGDYTREQIEEWARVGFEKVTGKLWDATPGHIRDRELSTARDIAVSGGPKTALEKAYAEAFAVWYTSHDVPALPKPEVVISPKVVKAAQAVTKKEKK